MTTTRQHLGLIASLYVSQAVPLGFVVLTLPYIMAQQGVPPERIGLLGLLAFPWLIKFMWAPLIDRYGSRRFGHYRSWIIPLQTISVIAVLAIANTDIHEGLAWLVVAGGVFMLCSATGDIATDGLAVRTISVESRGVANGIQVGGYYLGQLLGGGAVLYVFGRFGWTWAVLALACCLALPLVPALVLREPGVRTSGVRTSGERETIGLRTFLEFMRRPGAGVWVLILLIYRAGEGLATFMVVAMLVKLGLAPERVALVVGLVGSAAALTGAVVGGGLVQRLGRKPSLVVFGVLQAAALALYVGPASAAAGPEMIYAVVAIAMFAGGMATAALYTCMMDRCRPETAGTDFTLQQSLCAIGPLVAAGLSGLSVQAFGYPVHFALSATVALLAAATVAAVLTDETAAIGMALEGVRGSGD